MFDPAKSAEPPIKVFLSFNIADKNSSEDFLVAIVLKFFIASFFCFIIEFENLFFVILLNFSLCLLKVLFHAFSFLIPFFPIFLQSVKIL